MSNDIMDDGAHLMVKDSLTWYCLISSWFKYYIFIGSHKIELRCSYLVDIGAHWIIFLWLIMIFCTKSPINVWPQGKKSLIFLKRIDMCGTVLANKNNGTLSWA